MDPTAPNLPGAPLAAVFAHGVPVWLIALFLAIAAPLLVRLYADALERETASRTARFLARLEARAKRAPPTSITQSASLREDRRKN